MPHRFFGLEEVARYLNLSSADVERLVKDQDIPFQKHGSRLVFRRVDIDSWASPRVMGMEGWQLAEYHRKTSRDTRELVAHEAIMPELLRPEFVAPALPAKTKASVLREMAALAEKTGRVCDSRALLEGLEAREALCSTGLPGGLALLHCRSPESYLFEDGFIALGRTVQQIHFGAADGEPTDLFFLLGCPDPRIHLHTLARLCFMAQKTDLLEQLRRAPDADSIRQCIIASEATVLQDQRGSARLSR